MSNLWLDVLKYWVPDPIDCLDLKAWVAALLLSANNDSHVAAPDKALALYSNGAAGASTFLKLLELLVPSVRMECDDVMQFLRFRPRVSLLAIDGVSFSHTYERVHPFVSLIKSILSREKITYLPKYQKSLECYTPNFAIAFASNDGGCFQKDISTCRRFLSIEMSTIEPIFRCPDLFDKLAANTHLISDWALGQ